MLRPGVAALVVFLLGTALTASACAASRGVAGKTAAPAPAAPEPAAPEHPANPWLDPAREVLVQHCGSCHRSDLPTAVPMALQVFDLTRPVWSEHLVTPQYDGILTRVRGSSAVTTEEIAAVEAFVRCARDGACGAS